jgi:large subunit ribosomal protein L17
MRKRNKKGRILSRPKSQREALLRSLANSFFAYGKVKTTEAKAKELRSLAEKFISRAKDNKISDRKLLSRELNPLIVKKIFSDIAPQYYNRKGGYTRIVKLGLRKSDGAKVVIIELVK